MSVKKAIEDRRAYYMLQKTDISDAEVKEMAWAASLAPSCFNNQPWRFVFVRDPLVLEQLHPSLSRGNEWAKNASMIVAVFSDKKDDCLIKGREYYLFDTGLAAAFLMLRATEMGYVAHPIAGFDESTAKSALNIPDDFVLIALIIVAKHSAQASKEGLSQKQITAEAERPARLQLKNFTFANRFGEHLNDAGS